METNTFKKVSEYEVETTKNVSEKTTDNLGDLKDRRRLLQVDKQNKLDQVDANLQHEVARIQAETANANAKALEATAAIDAELAELNTKIQGAEANAVKCPPAELSVSVEGNKVSWEAKYAEKVVFNNQDLPPKYEAEVQENGSYEVKAVGWDGKEVIETAEVSTDFEVV